MMLAVSAVAVSTVCRGIREKTKWRQRCSKCWELETTVASKWRQTTSQRRELGHALDVGVEVLCSFLRQPRLPAALLQPSCRTLLTWPV
jgi:hypothetical protein